MTEGYYSSSFAVSKQVDHKVKRYTEDHAVSYKEALTIVLARDEKLAREYINNDFVLANN